MKSVITKILIVSVLIGQIVGPAAYGEACRDLFKKKTFSEFDRKYYDEYQNISEKRISKLFADYVRINLNTPQSIPLIASQLVGEYMKDPFGPSGFQVRINIDNIREVADRMNRAHIKFGINKLNTSELNESQKEALAKQQNQNIDEVKAERLYDLYEEVLFEFREITLTTYKRLYKLTQKGPGRHFTGLMPLSFFYRKYKTNSEFRDLVLEYGRVFSNAYKSPELKAAFHERRLYLGANTEHSTGDRAAIFKPEIDKILIPIVLKENPEWASLFPR